MEDRNVSEAEIREAMALGCDLSDSDLEQIAAGKGSSRKSSGSSGSSGGSSSGGGASSGGGCAGGSCSA